MGRIDWSQWGRDEFSALKRSGLDKILADGKTVRLDTGALTDKLAAYFVDTAQVSTVDELRDKGVTLNELMQKVVGFPVTTKEVVQEDIQGVIRGQLGSTVNGKVQGKLGELAQVWLITAKVPQLLVNPGTGLEQQSMAQVWAVTDNVELLTVYSVVPSHKRVTAFEVGNLRNSLEIVRRVPAMGPQLAAVHQQRQLAVSRANDKILAEVTADMSEIERRKFDAEVLELTAQLDTDPTLAAKFLAIASA